MSDAVENKPNAVEAPKGESRLFTYLIGAAIVGIAALALYQIFGCPACYY